MTDLNGQVAVVTAGCGGVGLDIARKLRDAGATVIATSRDETTVSGVSAEWKDGEERLHARMLTFGEEDIKTFFEDIISEFGAVHILVNAAGGRFPQRPVEETTGQMILEDVEASVVSAFHCAQVLVDKIEASKIRSVINIGSIHGSLAVDHRIYDDPYRQTSVSYAIGKGALVQMTRYLAAYWAPRGVRVNCVSPGGIRRAQDPAFLERYSARIPMGRMAEPDEVAGAVLFLAGEDSSYITGENIMLDGGLHAW